jgi:choline dehydrogenase-like flavoprotein
LVVIAAGTRGTVEILARSRYRGLPLSRRLGQSFSPDAHLVLAATDGARRAARQSGLDAAGSGPPGPAVTAALDLRRRRDKAERSIVTDLGLPQALVRLLAERRKMAAADAVGSDAKAGAETAASDADMLARSFVLYACGLDGGTGAFEAAGDGVRAVLSQPAAEARAQMRALVEGLVAPAPGARSAAAPGIEPAASRPVALDIDGRALTIGPLGGAVMGDTSEAGVVDHRGRVFDARPGARPGSLLPGLLVLDGSIVPRPIGCPPMLTITALAERAMILLERDMGVRHHSDRSAPAEGLSGADARGEVT